MSSWAPGYTRDVIEITSGRHARMGLRGGGANSVLNSTETAERPPLLNAAGWLQSPANNASLRSVARY
jgi:hypothetical protein